MSRYEKVKEELQVSPKIWLVTGVAGFIGSNLLEKLLKLGQTVVGVDDFSTGFRRNLDDVQESVTPRQWSKFSLIDGDIRDFITCRKSVVGIDYVLHQAALGSVPRSVADPISSNSVNIAGFLNMLHAAKEEGVASFVYAASSSTYGDHTALPKVEDTIGRPLSPYAVTKYVNELYAEVFATTYGFQSIGLRYFNVFGRRQNPGGAYAAVIPKWTLALIQNQDVIINGDGETSRDFCYIENVVQANILAAVAENAAKNQIYNVAVGGRTSLRDLFHSISAALSSNGMDISSCPVYRDFRQGDVRHSQADISKARGYLGYQPIYTLAEGLEEAMPWYLQNVEVL